MLRLGCLLIFIIFGGAIALSTMYLPWWGTLLVICGVGLLVVLVVPKLISRGVVNFAKGMIEEKSKVLRNATVIIHEMVWADPPPALDCDSEWDADEDEEGMDDEYDDTEAQYQSMRHLRMIVTIQPAAQIGKMSHYDLDDLAIVPFGKRTDMESLDEEPEFDSDADDLPSDEAILRLTELALPDGGWTDDFDKVTGEQKVRLLFAIPDSLNGRVKFQYYLEGVGDFVLPAD